jgi:hypothetical protein
MQEEPVVELLNASQTFDTNDLNVSNIDPMNQTCIETDKFD